MKELFSKKAKRIITAVSLSCFLCSPVSYVFSMKQVSAASLDTQIAYENQFSVSGFDKDDRWDRDRRHDRWDDKKDRHDKWKDKHDKWEDKWEDKHDKWKDKHDDWKDKHDDDKDFDRGDVTAAVLIGGVIGAVIAKNT